MSSNKYILGIDTSNYKTSVAVIDTEYTIKKDLRRLLQVKQGERGLRQSVALFQHINNLPEMIEEALPEDLRRGICAVASSSAPRSVENSYMPVFLAGNNAAKIISSTLGIQHFEFSHQDGHIAAVRQYSDAAGWDNFLSWHISGGTCELLEYNDGSLRICGGSYDISFGQVLDRFGVSLGFDFPCGEALDEIALTSGAQSSALLTPVKVKDAHFNLSGIETQCQRSMNHDGNNDALIVELFERFNDCISKATIQAAKETQLDRVLFSGGVAASRYLSGSLEKSLGRRGIECCFGRLDLSSDNAVGIAVLGGRTYGKTHQSIST